MRTIKRILQFAICYAIFWANYAQLESIREIAPQAFQVITVTGFMLIFIILLQAISKGNK